MSPNKWPVRMEETSQMGSISIFHWLILLVIFGLPLALIAYFVRKR